MPTASSSYLKTEEVHYRGPHPHQGLDDRGVYLNFLQEDAHYINDYHHGPSATVNTLSHIDQHPLSSRVDNGPLSALAPSPAFGPRLSPGLVHDLQVLASAFWNVSPGPSQEPPLHIPTIDQVRTYAPRQNSHFNVVYIARILQGSPSTTTP